MRLSRHLPLAGRSSTALVGCIVALCAVLTGSLAAQPVVQANYPLTVDLLDTTGTYGPVTLAGTPPPAPPSANGVCHNGMYFFGAAPGQDIRSPEISTLDATDFQIDIEFNITAFGGFNMPILMMGNGWRWIGFYVQPNGTLGAKHNNSNYTWSTTTVAAGTWYSASIRFELGVLQMDLNGVQIHQDLTIGTLNTGPPDLCFTTNDFSNGGAYNGCIRNVTLSNDTTLTGGTYQENSPASSLVANGQSSPGIFAPRVVESPIGVPALLDLMSTNTGFPWDVGQTTSPAIPGGAGTPGGQYINLDLTDPSFTSLFGLNFVTGSFANIMGLPVNALAPSTLTGQLAVVDPLGPDGIALSHVNQLNWVVCNNPENFDGATPGNPGTYPPCWTDGGGTQVWRVNNGTTPSVNTGPSGDNTTGFGNYMYCETSGVGAADTYILNGPPQQPTGGGVQFAYHMYGAAMGTLELQELQGGVWTPVWTLSGDQGNVWTTTPIILLTTNPTTLRWVYTGATSFTGDASIDDVLYL